MSVYIVKRLLLAIPTLLIVAIIVFFSIRLIPGDVIDLMLAEQYAGSTPYDRPRLEHELGLDVPIYIQFGRWIGFLSTPDEGYNGILQGNLVYTTRKQYSSLLLHAPIVSSSGSRG